MKHRRALAGVGGAAMLFGAISLGGARLDAAATHEPFSLRVEPRTHAVRVIRAAAGHRDRIWRGRIEPSELSPRVLVTSRTGNVVEGEDPLREVGFLHAGPGYATVELEARWRGDRVERIVDTALMGPFADRMIDLNAPTCDVGVAVSSSAIDRLLMPPVREQVLAGARAHPFMGPAARLDRASLEILDGGARFDLAVQGENRLEVRGRVTVTVIDHRVFRAELAELEHVAFTGSVRKVATGGAAAVGAVVTGPFAPVGAFVGYHLADRYVTRKARSEIENLLTTELAKASSFALFPDSLELIPGEARSSVHVQFCEDIALRPDGIAGGLSVTPTSFGIDAGWPLPGPVRIGAEPTRDRLGEGEDVRVELTIDAANALIEGWSANGLLMDMLASTGVVKRADTELREWTTLSLTALTPRLPPILTTAGGADVGWGVTLGGVSIGMTGFTFETPDERLVAGARGRVAPTWDPDQQRLELAIGLDDLWVTCVQGSAEATILRPCLGALLRAGDVQQRIDRSLASGLRSMPSLALGRIAQERVGVDITQLELTRPRPELIRLSAGLQPSAAPAGEPAALDPDTPDPASP